MHEQERVLTNHVGDELTKQKLAIQARLEAAKKRKAEKARKLAEGGDVSGDVQVEQHDAGKEEEVVTEKEEEVVMIGDAVISAPPPEEVRVAPKKKEMVSL